MDLMEYPLESIDEPVLERLKSEQVAEGKLIEYKSALPGRTDGEKTEFLADVSSFANASGGHLLYGVEEDAGIPLAIPGVAGVDPDAERARLENMMRDRLDPRVPGVHCLAVRLAAGGCVFVLRIPQSWARPHMVAVRRHSPFYSRNSAGKYPLDVPEIRAAFVATESIARRIRDFRIDRVGRIVAGDTPVPLVGESAIILHLLPISAFAGTGRRDLVSEGAEPQGLQTLTVGFSERRFNFDGLLVGGMRNDRGAFHSYTQLFRDGCIEAVNAHTLRRDGSAAPRIPRVCFEERLIDHTRGGLSYLKSHGVEPPVLIMLTLTGVRGFVMGIPTGWDCETSPIDRDTLLVPDVLFDGTHEDIARLMRPSFDAVWNACGLPRSLNYDEAGQWERR